MVQPTTPRASQDTLLWTMSHRYTLTYAMQANVSEKRFCMILCGDSAKNHIPNPNPDDVVSTLKPAMLTLPDRYMYIYMYMYCEHEVHCEFISSVFQ